MYIIYKHMGLAVAPIYTIYIYKTTSKPSPATTVSADGARCLYKVWVRIPSTNRHVTLEP